MSVGESWFDGDLKESCVPFFNGMYFLLLAVDLEVPEFVPSVEGGVDALEAL